MSSDSNIGKFRVIAPLGSGGMAKVLLATTTGAGHIKKLVALKKLRDDYAGNPEFLKMLLTEASVATRLSHPNVIHVYEVGEEHGDVVIAMEYVDGQSLRQISRKVGSGGVLTLQHYVRILCAALDGLHYAHELKGYDGRPLRVVHRDVSPQNILVTYDGNVKVVDFGIAKALDSGGETRTGILKGKVAYMAPEQARSEPLDARADVFGVGVMLWELATGRRLWEGFGNTSILGRLMQKKAPELPRASLGDPRVPAEIDRICEKALAWNPADRFATALEFKRALEQWLASTGSQVDAAEVGAVLAREFADERSAGAKLIEQAMNAPDVTSLAAFDVPVSTRASQPTIGQAASVSIPVKPSSRLGAWAMAVAAIALVAAVSLKLVRHRAMLEDKSSASAVEGDVMVTISTTPAGARLYLDGRRIDANPYAARHPRDDKPHILRAEAADHKPTELQVSLATDLALQLQLEPKAAVATPTATETGASESTAPVARRAATLPARSRQPAGKRTAEPVPAAAAAAPPAQTDEMMMPRVPKRAGPPIDTEVPWTTK